MFILYLLTILSSVSSEEQGVYTVKAWDCGFDGQITLVPHEDLHGWNIHLKFSDVVYNLQVIHFIQFNVNKMRFEACAHNVDANETEQLYIIK